LSLLLLHVNLQENPANPEMLGRPDANASDSTGTQISILDKMRIIQDKLNDMANSNPAYGRQRHGVQEKDTVGATAGSQNSHTIHDDTEDRTVSESECASLILKRKAPSAAQSQSQSLSLSESVASEKLKRRKTDISAAPVP
jgi:hypothetical protein